MQTPWETYYSDEARNFDLSNMPSHTVPDLVDRAARLYGPRPALTTILPTGAEATITYTQLANHAAAFAAFLREDCGMNQGDTVALMAPNCISFGVASLGTAMAGCIGTNINPLYTATEMQHQLADSNAQTLVIIDLFGDKVDQVIADTNVRNVVVTSIVDFFPPAKKALLGFVLKHIRKVVPAMATPAVPFMSAVSKGRKAARRVDTRTYTQGITPNDTALYQYTSGTTGPSKGAELHHQGVLANAYQAYLMTADLMSETGETSLVVLPLYHITAYTLVLVAGLAQGHHCILVPSPRPLSNLEPVLNKHEITWFTGINTLFAALMAEPWFDGKMLANLKFCGSGGAAQQTGVAQKWRDMTGVSICQGYGMTEITGLLTLNPPSDNRFGKVGIPAPGNEVRIVDDQGQDVPLGQPGEVIAKGPAVMTGYFNRSDENRKTLRGGWLYSGDIGVMDEDGFLEIVDRKKDMILVSGFNVAPNEIEDVISSLPGIVQVGVIGIPDDRTAEAPAAFVVRASEQVTEDSILSICRAQLTNYKIPKLIQFVDEVPITLSGKVLRRDLRQTYLASRQSQPDAGRKT